MIDVNFRYDHWAKDTIKEEDEIIEAHCFIPNGNYIILHISQYITFTELKEDLWEESEKYPLFGHLRDKSNYIIYAIRSASSTSSRVEEITDESQRVWNVQPYFTLFRIAERQELSEDSNLNKNITSLIGKTLSEFKTLKNPEVNDFRYKINLLGEDIAIKRSSMSLKEKILYQYPPKIAKTDEVPYTCRGMLQDKEKFWVVAKLPNEDISFTIPVSCSTLPSKLLDDILVKKHTKLKIRARPKDYILKICGQEEYIFGDYPLIQFQYIQDRLSRGDVPACVVMFVNDVYVFTSNFLSSETQIKAMNHSRQNGNKAIKQNTSTLRKKGKHLSSWDIDERFQFTIQRIHGLSLESIKAVEVGIQVGLFHGGKSLCEKQNTTQKIVNSVGNAEWNQTIEFDIKVYNIPRMARLCLVVYETVKNSKSGMRARRLKDSGKELFINPIAWVNINVFDYKHQLKTGGVTLYTWAYAEDADSEDLLHPLGTVEPNPRTEECSSITMTFHNYNSDLTILYPNEEKVLEYAETLRNAAPLKKPNEEERNIHAILTPYMYTDRLNDITEQERFALWEMRYECMVEQPDGLPCLLYCVEWNNRDEVSEVTRLLKEWPTLSVERALELLDYAYADPIVRLYAVDCLRQVKDEELILYLLQLVQAMKHESYLYCDLVEFLLQRALNNQRIGHFLFWHLRSEIHVPSVQIRFSLILEAYLRSSKEHISILMRQLNCLEKLRIASEQVKKVGKEKAKHVLIEYFSSKHVTDELSNITSPLNPSFRCKSLKGDKCKVMDSKMRPIWTIFENVDQHGDDINIIFKNGDDLRQDMLTLQMLRIMDRIWKQNGIDFRMNPYSCISMDRRLGMIEVILNAETIANIQKEKGMFSATSAFKKGSLYEWLKDHNGTEELLEKAINEFTLSCAGYCVATYVLGVADRHSDNIMVKKNGQLFHIDFGHILGHFKEKFGIRRERVPFVLTHDFVYVINKGRSDRGADDFKKFQKLCETAFMTLRKHGTIILSLFAMMISTGLPELSSEKDLNYLRETLVLDYNEQEALKHFCSKFEEALQNSWKTSLNWASHNFSKNNKQ